MGLHCAAADLGSTDGLPVHNRGPNTRWRKRSKPTNTTGVVYRVSSWLSSKPPNTYKPKGQRSSAPSPRPNAKGKAPSMAAKVVIQMGRTRNWQA